MARTATALVVVVATAPLLGVVVSADLAAEQDFPAEASLQDFNCSGVQFFICSVVHVFCAEQQPGLGVQQLCADSCVMAIPEKRNRSINNFFMMLDGLNE